MRALLTHDRGDHRRLLLWIMLAANEADGVKPGQLPSSGRVRKACTRTSIEVDNRETRDLEMPVMPIA